MASYWINQTTNFIQLAFNRFNPRILLIGFDQYFGHLGSTLKIKIMEKLNSMYNLEYQDSNHFTVIQNLILLLDECYTNKDNVLISPFYKSGVVHKNETFKFFDDNIKKFIEIKECG